MSAHALLAPSSGNQWGNCSAAPIASTGVSRPPTPETMAGDAAHWVCSSVLDAFKGANDLPLTAGAYVGMEAPNGVIIDDKMAEGAQIYADDVLEVAQEHGALQALLVEHRVHMPQIHAENWGTLDAALPLMPAQPRIYLWDYKHGHSEVAPFEDLQFIDYIAGLVAELNINGHDDQHITVIIRVVQPFCYSASGAVSEWQVLLSDLRPYFNQLQAKAAEAFTNPVHSTGPWCRYCPGVGRCEPGRKKLYKLFDYVNAPFQLDAMTGAELATERQILIDGTRVAVERLKAINQDLEHRVSQGEGGTGLVLEQTYGNLKWSVPDAEALSAARQFGIDASKPSILTPTQTIAKASTDYRAGFKQLVESMATRAAGGTKLIQAADSRVAAAFKRK